MSVIWQIFIYILILGGALYTVHTLRSGYLPFEMTIEIIRDWVRERKEKKKQ